jgi:hypothetical protein
MVDARDLKSLGTEYRAGSIPAPGTKSKSLQKFSLRAFKIVKGRVPHQMLFYLFL